MKNMDENIKTKIFKTFLMAILIFSSFRAYANANASIPVVEWKDLKVEDLKPYSAYEVNCKIIGTRGDFDIPIAKLKLAPQETLKTEKIFVFLNGEYVEIEMTAFMFKQAVGMRNDVIFPGAAMQIQIKGLVPNKYQFIGRNFDKELEQISGSELNIDVNVQAALGQYVFLGVPRLNAIFVCNNVLK